LAFNFTVKTITYKFNFPVNLYIIILTLKTHNLKNIDLEFPRDKLIVITGLSGSGKSSLAFDTIYAEGQRRYVESLSAYARQFLSIMEKPDVEHIEGLSPAISIEQKSTEIIVDRFKVREDVKLRLSESFETALNLSDGIVKVAFMQDLEREPLLFSAKFACPECDGLGINQFLMPTKSLLIAS